MMRAMMLHAAGQPLQATDVPVPRPRQGEVLVRVRACAVCRTDQHIVRGELEAGRLPLIPGHQIVATVEGDGRRVGIPWLGWTCGLCRYCRSERENLCDSARFTGKDLHGGYAEYAVADERFCFELPDGYTDARAAPLLCAGMIGYRALHMCGDGERIGLYGFGAAAHIVCQLARWEGRRVFAFTRAADRSSQRFALRLGAEWAGDALAPGPEELDAAIIFAPVGALVPAALRAVAKGGVVVCAGIHMSDIPAMRYGELSGERVVRSVANLTRRDGTAFLALAARAGVQTTVREYPLLAANAALDDLAAGRLDGAAVLVPERTPASG